MQVFGARINTPFRMPMAHIREPGFKSWLFSLFHFPVSAHTGRQLLKAQTLGTLPSMQKL